MKSPSLLWLLDFNVNEIFEDSTNTSTVKEQQNKTRFKETIKSPEEIMKIRKSTRLSAKRRINPCSPPDEEEEIEGIHNNNGTNEEDIITEQQLSQNLDYFEPPAAARFEECSSSSSSEIQTSSRSNKNSKKKKRLSKSSAFNSFDSCTSASIPISTSSPSSGCSVGGGEMDNKPKCTYTELIEKALIENPEGMTVSQIYSWIANNHTYFRIDDDRWKNSVRHNLSINPYFEKRGKCKNGAGHVWTIAESCRKTMTRFTDSTAIEEKGKTYNNQAIANSFKTETERIVGGILQQYKMELNNNNQQLQHQHQHLPQQQLEQEQEQLQMSQPIPNSCINPEDEFRDLLITYPPRSQIHRDPIIATETVAREQQSHCHYQNNSTTSLSHNIDEICMAEAEAYIYASRETDQPSLMEHSQIGNDNDDHENDHDRIYEFLTNGHSVSEVHQQPLALASDFNEFELLTFGNIGTSSSSTSDSPVVLGQSHHQQEEGNFILITEGSLSIDQDIDHLQAQQNEFNGSLVEKEGATEIQADHLFHAKELYLEDDEQHTTLHL